MWWLLLQASQVSWRARRRRRTIAAPYLPSLVKQRALVSEDQSQPYILLSWICLTCIDARRCFRARSHHESYPVHVLLLVPTAVVDRNSMWSPHRDRSDWWSRRRFVDCLCSDEWGLWRVGRRGVGGTEQQYGCIDGFATVPHGPWNSIDGRRSSLRCGVQLGSNVKRDRQ